MSFGLNSKSSEGIYMEKTFVTVIDHHLMSNMFMGPKTKPVENHRFTEM